MRVLPVRHQRRIGAQRDLRADLVRQARQLARLRPELQDLLHRHRRQILERTGLDLLRRVADEGDGCHGRHQPRAFRLHLAQRLVVRPHAVLDRIEAGADARVDAGLRVGVRGDLAPEGVGGIRDRFQLLVRELLAGAGVRLIERAAGGHDLDDVGAATDRLAHHAAAVVRAVADAAAGQGLHDFFAQVVIVGVAVGRTDGISRDDDLRRRDDAVARRVAQGVDRAALRPSSRTVVKPAISVACALRAPISEK